MKIYFTASLNQRYEMQKTYEKIVNHLEKSKNEVYEEILSHYLSSQEKNVSEKDIVNWHKKWTFYMNQCDCVVAEASHPSSVHVGFEIGLAIAKGKPVILLHKENADPVFINKLYSNHIIKSAYNENNIEETIDWCIEEIKIFTNRRFTFFINSQIDQFLENVYKNKGLSRSEFIRSLIENEMKKEENKIQ